MVSLRIARNHNDDVLLNVIMLLLMFMHIRSSASYRRETTIKLGGTSKTNQKGLSQIKKFELIIPLKLKLVEFQVHFSPTS